MITAQGAQQIRAGLTTYATVHVFRGHSTYPAARRLHRTNLGVLATMAFDRAETKAGKQLIAEHIKHVEKLVTDLQFSEIINHSCHHPEA